MRSPLRALAHLATVAALGCGTLACSGTWIGVVSPHFEMKTDASPSDATGWLTRLEQSYDLLTEVMPPPLDRERERKRIQIVLFAREDDFRAVAPRGAVAFFTDRFAYDLEPSPTAVLWEGASSTIDFQHELTHYFLRRRLVHLPVWLNEGLAQYYSTLRLADHELFIGEYLPGVHFGKDGDLITDEDSTTPIRSVPGVRELLSTPPERFYVQRLGTRDTPTDDEKHRERANYFGAWALVHMLENKDADYRRRFHAYLEALRGGTQPVPAWDRAFARVAPRTLEDDFREYLGLDKLHARAHPFSYASGYGGVVDGPLSAAAVHLLQARLARWGRDGSAARLHLDAALAADPGSSDVHYARGAYFLRRSDLPAAQAEADQALSADANDPRALLLRVEVELDRSFAGHGDKGQLASLSDRLARTARTADQRNGAAQGKSLSGHGDEALPLIEEAIARDPTCWKCLATKALLLFERCHPADALAAQERAVELLPEDVRAAGILRGLRLYHMAAGAPRSGPTVPMPDEAGLVAMCTGKTALFTEKEQALLEVGDASGKPDLVKQACQIRQQRWMSAATRCEALLKAGKMR